MWTAKRDLAGSAAILTGASRGIGITIARALAERGVNLVLVARSEAGLVEVQKEVQKLGVDAHIIPLDLSDTLQLPTLVRQAEQLLGPVELLINNAAVEPVVHYETVPVDEILSTVALNLSAAMILSRLVLPQMIRRGRGHVVNVASLGGLAGTVDNEIYCATKHGLVGFTRALRASLRLRGRQVSASVICPGFVSEAGMYEDLRRQFGVVASRQMGTSTPRQVSDAVLEAIDHDRAEVIVNQVPVRPLLALAALSPRLGEWIVRKMGAHDCFAASGDMRAREG